MIGKLVRALGGIFWASVLVVVFFGIGMLILAVLKKRVPVVGQVAGAVQGFAESNL